MARFDLRSPPQCLAVVDTPPGSRSRPDGVIFAVGGRNLLKIMRVGRPGIVEVLRELNPNAPAKGKYVAPAAASCTFEICDLAFAFAASGSSAGGSTALAAATKNGSVVVWDVSFFRPAFCLTVRVRGVVCKFLTSNKENSAITPPPLTAP